MGNGKRRVGYIVILETRSAVTSLYLLKTTVGLLSCEYNQGVCVSISPFNFLCDNEPVRTGSCGYLTRTACLAQVLALMVVTAQLFYLLFFFLIRLRLGFSKGHRISFPC